MKPVHEDIAGLSASDGDDRFASPVEARKKAMDFLARREYGQAELIRKLADRGFERDTAEQAVGQLTDEGLQSDARFAESFVQSRINQGKGPVRIRMDLGQRGITDATIELAREQRRKKFGTAAPADFTEKARQMRFLQYRGFEQDHIQSAF